MNVREMTRIKLTPAPKKQRQVPGYWNDPELLKLVEECLRTGQEQRGELKMSMFYAIVSPGWPLVESAMTPERKETFERVRIRLLAPVFTFRVEKGKTEKFPFSI